MKIGVIDVGGGSRDIFGAGILDYCLDEQIYFDYGIGISAGSANMASYMAGQRGRNYVFYTEYFFRKEYVSISNFLKKRNYVDLNYVYDTLSKEGGEYPLDYEKMLGNPAEFYVEACNAMTAEPIYFDKEDIRRTEMDVFKASSCIPVISRPVYMDGVLCFDGGLAESVPIDKALKDGCDKIVLILTRPRDDVRSPEKDCRLAKLLRHHYPKAAEALERRADVYNKSVVRAKELEKEGRLLIIAPESIEGLKTLTRDKESLIKLYNEGLDKGKRVKEFVSEK